MTRPFESAASGLVDESAHPAEQLETLEGKAAELTARGDWDAVIECRIKQLCLYRVLTMHVPQELLCAETRLAEAYSSGGYPEQAREHLRRAQEMLGDMDDVTRRRHQVDLLIADGALHLAEGRLDVAQDVLSRACQLARDLHGDADRTARGHDLLGQVAFTQGWYAEAYEAFSSALEIRTSLGAPEAALCLRIAETLHRDGRVAEALDSQRGAITLFTRLGCPRLDASIQLARWLEAEGSDEEALQVLRDAKVANPDSVEAVDVKRDTALLCLKLGQQDLALQLLHDVHYLERRLHGSQSAQVARTLKALGTVHLVRKEFTEAEQWLLQALRIFELDCDSAAIIQDIHSKLKSMESMM